MITYRLLEESDFTALYACFLKAFSDYQVDMQMSQEQLKVNNVDEELKQTLAFYKGLGFEVVLRQYEMVKTL
jgi:hypothetical protein